MIAAAFGAGLIIGAVLTLVAGAIMVRGDE
jgi:hypothetical protein